MSFSPSLADPQKEFSFKDRKDIRHSWNDPLKSRRFRNAAPLSSPLNPQPRHGSTSTNVQCCFRLGYIDLLMTLFLTAIAPCTGIEVYTYKHYDFLIQINAL